MKRIIYLLLISLTVASCSGVKKKGVNVVTFDSIVMQEKIMLHPNLPDTIPYATLDINFVYPAKFGSKEQLQKLQSIFYEKVLGEFCTNASSPDSAIASYMNGYVDMYREISSDFDEMLIEYGKHNLPYHRFSYYRSISNNIIYKDESLLSFSAHYTDYQGGAHGIYIQENITVNLNTIEKIQETDIFIPNYKEPLAQVIRKKLLENLREIYDGDDEYLKQYFFEFNNIYPNNNFLIDDKGLNYVYNVYEIAPYASGMFEVFIPYSEITHLLNMEIFAELFPDMELKEVTEEPKTAEEIHSVNYNEFPIAYIKNDKLYFFNPENHTIVEFEEETEQVFNCVYSDQDAMFYYTVSQNENLVIKQVDLSVMPAQPKLLFNLNKPTKEFYSETYGEKAKLKFIKDNLLLECDFSWDSYNFIKFYNYSVKDNTVDKINWKQFHNKFGCLPYYLPDETTDYSSIYKKADQLDLSEYIDEYNKDFEKEYYFEGTSADGSKIIFAIMIGMGDLPHGPYCVLNADGAKIQLLDGTDMGSSFKPLWCNNNVVYIRSYKSETEKNQWGDAKIIEELCYTQATDNSIKRIDQDVDYYATRKKHPIKQ
ncbi:MAG: RsiV family protein [Bacteroidales bacterium]|jgi:hypothetical protein